ncbi:hypothetical protein CCAL9344_04910 [Campylobacter sp. RM9344]|uniref:Lipoprotein n=1 Tax=Campylobacter californiensis TaxID=1032243 RepID=A0AAW3ZUI8_9BACT|nr:MULTISPECIES: hypothetical protein [unclassified Campylobacter]MBE2985025.1 hypothetical protein [Campylobacter sp. RM6883]MBE2986745.1 hypothetical protein [Campylobacter sp. RM12919]MBE2988461.1 hypothetical protein [Campylobacter sp. RM12920]MBE2995221.1 hypothetical protein [Campylobacter sp. RM6913]MBE3022098.1 hypothetical protein [Campylobacter sp. 7477a]MBE3029522.1 hypothetical protein [Campylobacter sp. RM9344]
MRILSFVFVIFVFFTGCSNTWSGIKADSSNAAEWTKEKINDGATYVKEKTE